MEKNGYSEIAKRLEQYFNPRKRVNSKVLDITKTMVRLKIPHLDL